MTEPLDTLVPFVSRLQFERLRASGAREEAVEEWFDGTVLFLDAVGFSSAAERLRGEGAQGAERLSSLLSAYFHPLLAEIRRHGGDVLFFAGDALAVAWYHAAGTPDGLAGIAVRATRCALALQKLIPDIAPPSETRLRFRASLGSGPFGALELGGVRGRWMQVVRGTALAEACRVDQAAEPGQVVLCPVTRARIAEAQPAAETREDGDFCVTALGRPCDPTPLPPLGAVLEESRHLARPLAEIVSLRGDLGDGDLPAEFRQVTVAFITLVRPTEQGTPPDLMTLQRAVAAAQAEVDRFEGTIYELVEDDKGTSLIAAFGLPGASHPNDPTRALLATRAIRTALLELQMSPVCGVATGLLYCGPHGDEGRRHYAMIGPTINLAARLMTLAPAEGILCDGPTRKLALERIDFQESGWTTPKGFPTPVALFEVTGERESAPDTESQPIVGRVAEQAILAQTLEQVWRDRVTRLLVIQAEPGMGKSTLIDAAQHLADARSIPLIRGHADSFEIGTAYFAFRRVAREWLGFPPDADHARKQALARQALADAPALSALLPLVSAILDLDLAETPETAQMRGPARAEAVREIFLHAATRYAEGQPRVLVIEDGHWLDAASWSLLPALMAQVPGLLIILTTRPTPAPPEVLTALQARDGSRVLTLEGFSRADSEALIRQELGVSEVAPAVLDLVTRRAEGNPFFVREVLRSLRESGGIRIRSARVELVLADDAVLPLPATLEGILTSRIDRLERPARTTLKVAAVLGRHFDPELLRDIHPGQPGPDTLQHQLEELVAAALLKWGDSASTLYFNHALTHETAYNMLSYEQRATLHRAAAERLEAVHAGNFGTVQARLGYHYRLAELPERAVPYLAAAGEAAVDAYASRDAVDLLTMAITLDERVRGLLDREFQQARWCRLIGQAHYHLDQQSEARDWYQRCIGHTGASLRSPRAAVFVTLIQALVAPGRITRFARTPPSAAEQELLVEGLAAARELAIIYLWANDKVHFALRLFESARVARRLGPSRESADAFAMVGFLLSLVGLRRTGERITAEAVPIAEQHGDRRQLVSTTMLAGMIRTQNGRPLEGLPFLHRSDETATALRSGLYRHRPKYMLADTLFWLGRYAEARSLFQASAELARSAEHRVMGLANAMVALTLVREGRPEAAIQILESPDGVPNVLEGKIVASVVIALGILAEARWDLGDHEAALDAVREADSWLTPADDGTGYFASILGYGALARVRVETGLAEGTTRRGWQPDPPFLATMGRLRKLRRLFPAARARVALVEGQAHAARGGARQARRAFQRAIAAATAHGQPYELGRSLTGLAALLEGPARTPVLDQAIRIFDTHGMTLESGRARTLLHRS